jgi:hypothetical protein
LVRAKLATDEQIAEALKRQALHGGRIGDHLVTMGVISPSRLEAFLNRMPVEPQDIAATGIDEIQLLNLLLKSIYSGRLESVRQYVAAIKLPYHIVLELTRMAVDRQLLFTKGTRRSENPMDMTYGFTEEGKRYAIDAMQQMRYTGPTPVTLEEFCEQVNRQKLTNEVITYERIRDSVVGLSFDESIVEQAGPALNSGRAILLYGPPGNGKTSLALRLANVFTDIIYVPHAIIVENQIIRVYDPSVHIQVTAPTRQIDISSSFIRPQGCDARWVPCKRPFIVAGGELTLEMLDLRYNSTSHFYEAPLHVKALGGCFVIDDFGRQLVSPTKLLNRWIVPLESRVDYLAMHTGNSIAFPFEEMVIFSTNLEPEDLMDPAFLRRLPYKIEVGPPSVEIFKRIFASECSKHGLTLPDQVFQYIVYKLTQEKGLPLAAFQAKFIIDQVIASCRFLGQTLQFTPKFLDYAIDNLRVKRAAPAKHGGLEIAHGPIEVAS